MALISVNNTLRGKNQLVTGVDPSAQTGQVVPITAEYRPLIIDSPGGLEGPVNPVTGKNNPPLPVAFRPPGYVEPEFDYLELGRLQLQPTKTFTTLLSNVRVVIDGVDYSKSVNTFDYSFPLRGPALGKLVLVETLGVELDPSENGIATESVVEVYAEYRGLAELITKAYVVSSPVFTLGPTLSYTLELELGCQLQLFENSNRTPELICDSPAQFARDLAVRYARSHGLFTRLFPLGHRIEEATVNNFEEESAYSFLQQLYDPVKRDVRCNKLLDIVCPERPRFGQGALHRLAYDEVVEDTPLFSTNFDGFNTCKVTNDFTKTLPFALERTSYKRVSGNIEDDRAWFQGGYTETVVTETTLGDTVIHRTEVLRGYVPTNPQPWSRSQVEGDVCDDNPFETLFQDITTKTMTLRYQDHSSGSFLVTREQNWERGLLLRQLQDNTYDLFFGDISYTNTLYQNVAQINAEVCEKDYLWVQKSVNTVEFDLDEDFQRQKKRTSLIQYQVQGTSPTQGQTSFTGIGQTWNRVTTVGEIEDSGLFVVQPDRLEEDVSPPTAQWIRPARQEVINFHQHSVERIPGSRTPVSVNGPFCYNREQLTQVGDTYLRDTFGLSNSLSVLVPWDNPAQLGEYVQYVNRLGRSRTYRVYNIEVNITNNLLSKNLTLILEV